MAESTENRLSCAQVTALLIDYVTGEIDPATTQALQAHLHHCRDCVAFLRTYTETIRTTRTLRYDDIPEEMQNRMHAFLRQNISGASQG
jgi:anti-sigma factor RsiW